MNKVGGADGAGVGAGCGSGTGTATADTTVMKGWLYKWTNYLKGYQKRWFVLCNGTLSYYRNKTEIGHTCRGSINLQGAFIHTEDSCNFVISNGGTQTFHLKANGEVERQKWVTALELARVRAIKAAESDEEEELKYESSVGELDKNEMQNMVKVLQAKLEDLTTCQDLIAKHGASLQRSLADLEQLQTNTDVTVKIRGINERATLFRITTNALMNAAAEYTSLAQSQGRKWQRVLQHEHDQRLRLQEQLEQLARQHSALEKAAMKEAKEHGSPAGIAISPDYSDDESEVFHDATEGLDEYDAYSLNGKDKESLEIEREEEEAGEEAELPKEREKASKLLQWEIVSRPSVTPEFVDADLFVYPPSGAKHRRQSILPRPNSTVNLWSIMKNCIGKELSKIPMPVNFNEPLSMLQRLTEDLEYSSVIDKAAELTDPCEQMCYVAAFTVSSYSTTTSRTGKPFNPLLGETFECDRTDDFGWRSICEQVSHHPPAAAMYAESKRWKMWQEFTMSSKFRGKYLSVIPLGYSHLEFPNSGHHYTWRKVTTTIHNIIVGKLWIDNHGEMTIEEVRNGIKCHLKYIPYSYFSRDTPRKVTGVVTDKEGEVQWVLQGTWDESIECAKVIKQSRKSGNSSKPIFETLTPKVIWRRHPHLEGSENFYNFTLFAVQLNEPEDDVAPTDSRLRPDQRLMEEGRFDEANAEKLRLEEKQRTSYKNHEIEAEAAMIEGRPYKHREPIWFTKQKDPWTGSVTHLYNGKYWQAKSARNFEMCPDIF